MSTRGQKLSEKYATALIACLTSSKSDTRNVACALVESALTNGSVNCETFKKSSGHLKPALQRTVAPIILKYSTVTAAKPEKENQPSRRITQVKATDTKAENARSPAALKRAGSGDEPSHLISSHPLAPTKDSSGNSFNLKHPSFPDEPSLTRLKKAWGGKFSSKTTNALFPPTGFRKQDDAARGCEILLSGIDADVTREEGQILDNVEPILVWLAAALCSKETPQGLKKILDTTRGLFAYLVAKSRELNECECMCFVPYFVEKCASAKVSSSNLSCHCLRSSVLCRGNSSRIS